MINFLNPFVLFGLGAAALPVVIHLLSRRRAEDVPFPSIEFLERMKTDRMRRLMLKQILVLILRTLIILCVILAFARPAVNSAFMGNARSSTVVIIDNSASMQYVHNGERIINTAVRKAREILEMLGKEDTSAILLSDGKSTVVDQGMTLNKKSLSNALSDIEPSWTAGDTKGSFSRALDMLASSGVPNKEIYFITDGAVDAFPDSLQPSDSNVRLYIVHVGPEKRSGAVIERIELIDRLLTAGKPVTFRVRGMLYSGEQEMNIEFFVNGERKGRSQVTRHSGDFVETGFTYTPESPGWYSVYAMVNDGRFEPGEIRRIVMHVPRKAKVVIIGDLPDDIYFPAKALNPDPDRSAFSIRKVLSVDLTPTDITQADVVIFSGVSNISDNLYKTLLTSVVERGTGLIVFPSSQMSKSLYDDGIFRDMFPVSVEKRLSQEGNKSGNIAVIDWFDISHPILAGVSRGGNFQKPEVISYVKMRPQGKIRVIARFNDGSMAVGDTFCSKGRVVVFAVAPSISDSELPLTGIFVPLFIRAVQYLSGTEITGNMYVANDIIKEKVGDASLDAAVSIKPEDSPARLVEVVPGEGGVYIQGEIASKPGFNSVYAGKEERARYSVDIPVSEILFERESAVKLAEVFNTVNWKVVDESENLSELILNDRYGTELFGLFIILAGLLLVVEMIISKKA